MPAKAGWGVWGYAVGWDGGLAGSGYELAGRPRGMIMGSELRPGATPGIPPLRRDRWGVPLTCALLASLPGVASATDYPHLERVESPVFEAKGDHAAIAKRAQTCIAQNIKPGFTTAPTIISADMEAGVIVANNAFQFSHKVTFMDLSSKARSTLTFQAKDGRFRIIHTDIEEFNEATKYGVSVVGDNNWYPIPNRRYGGAPEAQTTLEEISQSVADCVKNAANDNW